MADKSKYPPIYWAEYADSIINKYNLKETVKGEHHGPCPACGGTDRFWIKEYQGQVRVHCRQCNDFAAIYDEMRHDGVLEAIQEREWTPPIAVNDLSDFKAIEPYHVRKGVELFNAKVSDDVLYVPIVDISAKTVNRQTIKPDGTKRFDVGKPVEGCFSVLNGPLEGVVYIGEGWATCASVAMCTKRPTVFALNSGNLPKVAAALQEAKPDCKFIVAADNDDAGLKAAKDTGLPYRAPRQAKWDWNDVMVNHGPAAVAEELKRVKMPKPLFVPLGDLEFKAPEWLIDGMLEANTFSMCFGSPAAGKTFLVLDMALCIASGKSFHGHDVKQGPVFYIAGEGHNGFARRAAAWSKANNISLKGLPFFKSSRSIVLTEDDSVAELLDTVEAMVQQHGDPQIIVVDTLARAMGAADENSTQAAGGFISAVDEIRSHYDCTVLAVHHTGHAQKDRARGSSALLGAVDAEFMVEKWFQDDECAKVEVKFTKMKDAKMPKPMNFVHAEIELVGADLEKTSSVVLEYTADTKPKPVPKNAKGKQCLLDALNQSINNETRAVTKSELRDIYDELYKGETDGANKKAFNRAIEAFKADERIKEENSMVYVIGDIGT